MASQAPQINNSLAKGMVHTVMCITLKHTITSRRTILA